MTGAGEYRVLQRVEEELASALEPAGLVEAGRVTGRGMRTFHYYGPDLSLIHISPALRRRLCRS